MRHRWSGRVPSVTAAPRRSSSSARSSYPTCIWCAPRAAADGRALARSCGAAGALRLQYSSFGRASAWRCARAYALVSRALLRCVTHGGRPLARSGCAVASAADAPFRALCGRVRRAARLKRFWTSSARPSAKPCTSWATWSTSGRAAAAGVRSVNDVARHADICSRVIHSASRSLLAAGALRRHPEAA